MINSKRLLRDTFNISKENNKIWAEGNSIGVYSESMYIEFPEEVLSSIIPVGEKLDKIEFLLEQKITNYTLENNLLGFKPETKSTKQELNDDDVLNMIDKVYDDITCNRVFRYHDIMDITDKETVVHSSVDSAVDRINTYKSSIKALKEEICDISKKFAESYNKLFSADTSTLYNDLFNKEMEQCKLLEKDLICSEAMNLKIDALVKSLAESCAIVQEAISYDINNIAKSKAVGLVEAELQYSKVMSVLDLLEGDTDTLVRSISMEDEIDTIIDAIKKDNSDILSRDSIMAPMYLHNIEVPKTIDDTKFRNNQMVIDNCIEKYKNISESITNNGWNNILEHIENGDNYLSINSVKELDMNVNDKFTESKKLQRVSRDDITLARDYLKDEPDKIKRDLRELLNKVIERKKLESIKDDKDADTKDRIMANVDMYAVLNKISKLQQKIYHFEHKLKYMRMIVIKSIGCKDDKVKDVLDKCKDNSVIDIIHGSKDNIEDDSKEDTINFI